MPICNYEEYRAATKARVDVNDSVMGLLAGAHIASQVLVLTEGSVHTLGELFPQIPHIRRFNMRTHVARDILTNSETVIGRLAVPALLGLHEDLIKGMVDELSGALAPQSPLPSYFNAKTQHDFFHAYVPSALDADSIALFNYIRVLRNKLIHEAGIADQELEAVCVAMTPSQTALWHKITRSPFTHYVQGASVKLALPELIACLALTKRIAEDANAALVKHLPRGVWIGIAKRDWLGSGPKGDAEQKVRNLRGYARLYYGHVSMTEDEIRQLAGAPRKSVRAPR